MSSRGRASTFNTAAYGGSAWRQCNTSHGQELGTLWGCCGIDSEWWTLKSVLLHQPGEELNLPDGEHDAHLLLDSVDIGRAREEHQWLREIYQSLGAVVHEVLPDTPATPNLMFCADLFVMTPQGAILARPASSVRAGEERTVARRLADIGVPILPPIIVMLKNLSLVTAGNHLKWPLVGRHILKKHQKLHSTTVRMWIERYCPGAIWLQRPRSPI